MKKMYGRFQQKHDTEANWLLATNFAPLAGELIIYDADENYDYPRFKVGIWDGESEKTEDMLVSNLPFAFPSQISTTYAELKQLRDSGRLIPGMFYRITDYECTTVQERTRAMNNKFDIIVQALSSNTLSENASADYHYTFVSGTISSSVIESDNVLVENAVVPYYYEYIDFEGPGEGLVEYKTTDGFIAYDYLENNDGQTVPVIYKTDVEAAVDNPDEYGQPDYMDEFYYVGRETIDRVPYDKWRKITDDQDGILTWDSTGRAYLYTNVIVEDTNLPQISGISSNVANIPAWELKYCLDNDTERFAWADDEQGKGIIYYMKDEWNNECPYDFKNIQFQRTIEWQKGHSDFIDSLGLAVDDLQWFYTFSYINMGNLTAEDLTLKQDLPSDGEGVKYGTHDNSMLPYTQDAINVPRIALNNNVMIYCPEADDCFYGCYCNSFKNKCFSNTFGNSCYSNTFGDNCYSNNFGNDYCSNTFGDICYYNTFGNDCRSNTFGDKCHYNTFGNSCYYNTFGNHCSYNTFGSSADSLIAYAKYICFADDCSYVKLLNSESEAGTNYVQNITISVGISGSRNSPLELQVSRNAPPVAYEAAGTTHIILD